MNIDQSYAMIQSKPLDIKYVAGLTLMALANNDLVVFCDCGDAGHLKIFFSNVVSYQVHEEFHYPEMLDSSESPKPTINSTKYYYPFLMVINSKWKSTFADYMLYGNHEEFTHYQILSLSNILDVISAELPIFSEITEDELLSVEDLIIKKLQ